jgi:hypothetical protein
VSDRIDKVWLDDLCNTPNSGRMTPSGWIGVTTPEEAIELLKTNTVDVLSLDNDLGLCGFDPPCEGRHVADWLEEALATGVITRVPRMYAHTSNPVARQVMMTIFRRIQKRHQDNHG